MGFQSNLYTLNIILPVGISFYTFQTLSYTIDCYRKKIEPTKDLIVFASFVSFFPQLVAGPIERAANLLPQFQRNRFFNFERARSGVELIIWGLFQKIVIADNCATYVNSIFENYDKLNSLSLLLGAFYFAFQIYGDFAGYSNIAIGSARLLGFDLMRNFNYPYFSKNIGEFWKRWHISLSTWFRDYLYIPLGGSAGNRLHTFRNISIVFIISGLWHGANWTFISWSVIHALLYIPLIFRRNKSVKLSGLKDLPAIVSVFILVCISWVFFRSPDMKTSLKYIGRIFTNLEFKIQYLTLERYSIEMLLLVAFFVFAEWNSRKWETPIHGSFRIFKTMAAILLLLLFGVYSNHSEFIYFQF